MKFLQKLGKALMLPVAVLPICGILMGIGYWLCPATMQGGEIQGVANLIGLFLVKAGGALIDNMAILFAIGVGVGMSEKNDGTGAIAALASWLMLTTLLSTGFVTTIMPSIAEDATKTLAFNKIANPFIGIIAGIIGSMCYNKFKDTKLPDWLSFFSGKRCVAIIAGVVSILASVVLLFVWPLLFGVLVAVGEAIVGLDVVGAGVYAFLNRLLIPTGLHHALNNVFWFDTIGLGDLQHFWAGETSADVSWSLGMYMSGFFPCMMFGIPGAALAMVKCAKPAKKKAAIGLVASAAICSFICGVTEPFEFAFMFLAPGLYVIYAALYGIFTMITVALGFRAGFSFSAGAMDLLFSSSLPAAQKIWLIIPLGIAAFLDAAKHMVLPVLVMSVGGIGSIARYVRASMIDALRMDYIKTARSKGLREKVVIYVHAFRNALIPIVTVTTWWLIGLFGGSIVIESIFLWDGLGKMMISGLNQRDFSVVLAMQMFYVILSLLGNVIMDIAYTLVDPRVRLEN